MLISYLIIFVLIILDLVLKLIFSNIFQVGQISEVIPNVLRFGYIQNTGASFGILEGEQFLFLIITIIALIFFGYLFSQSNLKTKRFYTIGVIFLIAGTLGNAIDLMVYGYVIDYIQIPFLPFVGNTYFNLADTLLVFGVAMLAIEILILDTLRNKKKKEGNNDDKV